MTPGTIRQIGSSILFRDIDENETRRFLSRIGASEKSYLKGEAIVAAGNPVHSISVVTAGSVNIERIDYWGNRSILNHVGPGGIFAETYACCPGEITTVDAVAAEDSSVAFLNFSRFWQACTAQDTVHVQILRNLMQVLSEKNLRLNRRMMHIAPKSIRGRVMAYLSDMARKQGADRIRLPFDRQQMADYLGVDRSALSGELGKMKRDGMIDYRKNEFHILKNRKSG